MRSKRNFPRATNANAIWRKATPRKGEKARIELRSVVVIVIVAGWWNAQVSVQKTDANLGHLASFARAPPDRTAGESFARIRVRLERLRKNSAFERGFATPFEIWLLLLLVSGHAFSGVP
jgi:hypothetical protein